MKIIIVDDNEITRDLMKAILQAMGHQVLGEADNGNDAVTIFKELRPDVVLMDLIMPGKSGLEALQEIRVVDPAAKVVMATAVQQDGISQQLLEKGAVAILYKPFSYSEFEEVVKKLV